jgi:WD40 repeat protein
MNLNKWILIAFGFSSSGYAAEANRCAAIFADAGTVVEELAKLRVDSEQAPSEEQKKMISTLYSRKYGVAQKSGMDLSELPKLIEKFRQQEQKNQNQEQDRRKEARENERRADISVWSSMEVLTGQEGKIRNIIFSPDGKYFVGYGNQTSSSLVIRDLQTRAIVQELKYGNSQGAISAAAFGADGKTVVVAYNANTEVDIWDISTGKISSRVNLPQPHRGKVQAEMLAVSKNGEWIAVATTSHRVFIMEARTGNIVWDLGFPVISTARTFLGSLRFSGDSRFLAVTMPNKAAAVYDIKARKEIKFNGAEPYVYTASFSASTENVVTGGESGEVTLWDTLTGQELQTLKIGGAGFESRAVFIPGSENNIVTWQYGRIQIWNISGKQEILELPNPSVTEFYSVEISPDGRTIYAGGYDGEIYFWKREQEKE